MSHHHHTSHVIIGLVLGALATQFPRTAGAIVLLLFATAICFFGAFVIIALSRGYV